jgi:HSP20 family protein
VEQVKEGDLLEGAAKDESGLAPEVGELAIDVFEDEEMITIKAPMAGVKTEDLDLSITDETVSIKGTRQTEHAQQKGSFLLQECYWGAFERTFTLPVAVDSEKAKAHLKNGLLTITVPKAHKSKIKVIEVKEE